MKLPVIEGSSDSAKGYSKVTARTTPYGEVLVFQDSDDVLMDVDQAEELMRVLGRLVHHIRERSKES